jgi:hypothetical protein
MCGCSTTAFPRRPTCLKKPFAEAAADPAVQVPMLVTLSFALLNMGRLEAAMRRVAEAVDKAGTIDRPDLLGQALGLRASIAFLRGDGIDEPGMQMALQLDDLEANIPFALRPRVHNALMRTCWIGVTRS